MVLENRLFKNHCSIDAPDSGTIAKNKTATLGYLAQNTGLESDKTVWEEMTKPLLTS